MGNICFSASEDLIREAELTLGVGFSYATEWQLSGECWQWVLQPRKEISLGASHDFRVGLGQSFVSLLRNVFTFKGFPFEWDASLRACFGLIFKFPSALPRQKGYSRIADLSLRLTKRKRAL